MHPKGTCSASLHCVGIAPYEIDGSAFVKRRGDVGIAPYEIDGSAFVKRRGDVGIAPYEINGSAFVKRRAGAAECVRVMSLPPSRRSRDTSATLRRTTQCAPQGYLLRSEHWAVSQREARVSAPVGAGTDCHASLRTGSQ